MERDMADEIIIPIERVYDRAIGPAHPGYIAHAAALPIPTGAYWRTGHFSAVGKLGSIILYGHALVVGYPQ